jgi:hypothetical protein
MPPLVTMKNLWDDIIGNTYDGCRYKLDVKGSEHSKAGVAFEPFEVGFLDGIARAQIMHGFVSMFYEEAICSYASYCNFESHSHYQA